MPNRIIKESINESRALSEVSFFAEDLFKRLITYADDYGRFNADYQIILARLYPRAIQIVSESDLEDALIELSGAGKIGFYTASPKKEIYGRFPNWSEHQRVRESKNKYPDPADTGVNDWYLRRYIPMKLKQKIIERDGFKCKECGKHISTMQDSRRLIKMGAGLYHIDYIVPLSQGGFATEENLRLICPQCRSKRERTFTVDEILEMVSKEIGQSEDSGLSDNFAADCGEPQKVAADCGLNPIQSESNRIQSNRIQNESNPNPNLNPTEDARACACEPIQRFDDFFSAYPSQKRMLKARGMYAYVLKTTENLTEDMLVSAAKNYAEECSIKRGDGMYIMHPDNWLRDSVWADYLPGTYQKPEKKSVGKVQDNNNFQHRQYDFDSLEGQLLGVDGGGGT